MAKIKVFIVDDSGTVRRVFSDILSKVSGIEVLGSAVNPKFAWPKMEKCWPDVIISDIEMPEMNGIDFLKKIMTERPTPVVICSGYAADVGEEAVEALTRGAVDVIHKPSVGIKDFLQENSAQLIDAVKAASKANLRCLKRSAKPRKATPGKLSADVLLSKSHKKTHRKTKTVVAIGCSTGGTQALEEILMALPSHAPGIMVVQHMPAGFTKAFAKRLNGQCRVQVKEAEAGDCVKDGCVYIAPGDKHMLLRRVGNYYEIETKDGPLVSRHKPSVDVLFRSTANSAGSNAVGIIMTGMGDDGAAGLMDMRESGARTYAQDEASCVVYGMPKVAYERGAVEQLVALGDIHGVVMMYANKEA